jgi:hypothetical protein
MRHVWAMDAERTPRNARRLLAAMFRLAKGQAGVGIPTTELREEIHRVHLFDMSEEEFHEYEQQNRAFIDAKQALVN